MTISMTHSQEQRQKHDLILTLKKRLSLQVLVAPYAKLEDMIQEALRENPLIEIEAWNNYLQRHSPTDYVSRRAQESDLLPDLQGTLSKKPSLIEHLTRQLCESRLSREEMMLGEHIIGNLDGNGYLGVSLDELAREAGMTPSSAEAVLKGIQGFDPAGVAARNARECLLVQLEQRGEGSSLAARIITSHLEELAAKRYGNIADALGVEVIDITQAHKYIASLEPKPARDFDCEPMRVVIPEVWVERADDGWRVRLNDANLPRLHVNENRYHWLLKRLSREQRVMKNSLKMQLQEAQHLLQAVHDRQKTLLSVAQEIFKRQEAFLDSGRSWVRPLMMKEIAEEIRVHETTISRAVSDKFARTPHGIFPLKFFFQASVPRKDGPAVSSEHVKAKIRALVDAEDRRKPLTDDEIVRRLGDAYAIKMARRTVNKYRDLLSILPAHQRRRESESVADLR